MGLAIAALAVSGLIGGCAQPPAATPTQPAAAPTTRPAPIATPSQPATDAPTQPTPVSDLPAQINALWRTVDTGATAKDRPPIAWSPRTTPAFPTTWPPTPATTWVRYVYAAGRDLGGGLADGERVARPWARVEWRPGAATATLVPLSARLEPLDIQGVRPIDAATLAILRTEDRVTAAARLLTALPDPTAAETIELRAFYRAWLGLNGVIASAIRPDHGTFLAWVAQ